MSSKSRRIGTSGEVRVAKYLAESGWPYAEHRALTGRFDKGDITGTPGLCWQVKAGEYAWTASDQTCVAWLEELQTQRLNSSAEHGVLVVARHYKQPKDWRAFTRYGDLVSLSGLGSHEIRPIVTYDSLFAIPVEMRLEQMCQILTRAGYGDERRQDFAPDQETSR